MRQSEAGEDAVDTEFEQLGSLVRKPAAGRKAEAIEAAKAIANKKNIDSVENMSGKGKSDLPACRICLGDENEVDNPLFAPCKCAGSMRLIHQGCLRTWFAAKRIVKRAPVVTTYFWKNLECELCKTAYPYEVRSLDGRKLLNIIEYDTPEPEAPG